MVFISPFKHFGRAYGEVIDNVCTITVDKVGIYNILIFGDRQDEYAMKDFNKYGVEYPCEDCDCLEPIPVKY